MSVRAVRRVTAELDQLGLVPKSQPGGEEGARGRGRVVYVMDPAVAPAGRFGGHWWPPNKEDLSGHF